MAFDFGDKVTLKDGFEGKITGRTNSNPAYYDVTSADHKRVNGIPEQNIFASKSYLDDSLLREQKANDVFTQGARK